MTSTTSRANAAGDESDRCGWRPEKDAYSAVKHLRAAGSGGGGHSPGNSPRCRIIRPSLETSAENRRVWCAIVRPGLPRQFVREGGHR